MLHSVINRISRLFAWWIGDIRGRKSLIGKAASLVIGIFVLCCACTFGLAAVRSTGQAVALVATNTPTLAPTNTLQPTNTPEATAPPPPSATPAPASTEIPSPTPEPATTTPETRIVPTDIPAPAPSATPAPTTKPKPTAKPVPAIAPTAKPASAPIPPAVDVGAAPCQPGQIKGNRNSGIYHAPGQRDYGKTQANVECFNTEAEAQAAGYRRAKR
jgi:outer membrane biosynthesis protein TonB